MTVVRWAFQKEYLGVGSWVDKKEHQLVAMTVAWMDFARDTLMVVPTVAALVGLLADLTVEHSVGW